MDNEIKIRVAEREDAAALLNIYAPYVRETAVSFEYEAPSVEEFQRRIAEISEKFPYLVAECNGQIVGYAYAKPLGERAAYGWAVETAIYVERAARRTGVGRALYERLEEILKAQNVVNLYACIAYTDGNSARLNGDSVCFHAAFGYRPVAKFRKCGYKFDEWFDVIWMEKVIGEHRSPSPTVRPWREVISCR